MAFGEISGQGLFESRADPAHGLGYAIHDESGNRYRYVRAGAALVVGDVQQTAAQITVHQNLVPTANVAAGATVVRATLGAAAATLNQYAGGWLYVSTAPGFGQRCRISGHDAALSGGVITLRLDPVDALRVAITTVSRIGLQRQPYNGVVSTPATTLTGAVVGVAVAPIASGEYGWVQDDGVAMLKIAGTPPVGDTVVAPSAVAGAVTLASAPLSNSAIIGTMCCTGIDGAVQPVTLRL